MDQHSLLAGISHMHKVSHSLNKPFSYLVGIEAKFSILAIILFHILCMCAVKAQERM